MVWKLLLTRAGLAISAAVLILVYHFWTLHKAAEGARAVLQAKWDESIRLQHEATQRDNEHAVSQYTLEVAMPALPAPVIRLCPPVPVVARTAAEGSGDPPADTRSVPAVSEGSDVGPALDALVRRADEVSARLRAVQSLF